MQMNQYLNPNWTFLQQASLFNYTGPSKTWLPAWMRVSFIRTILLKTNAWYETYTLQLSLLVRGRHNLKYKSPHCAAPSSGQPLTAYILQTDRKTPLFNAFELSSYTGKLSPATEEVQHARSGDNLFTKVLCSCIVADRREKRRGEETVPVVDGILETFPGAEGMYGLVPHNGLESYEESQSCCCCHIWLEKHCMLLQWKPFRSTCRSNVIVFNHDAHTLRICK